MFDAAIPYGAYWSTPFARWQGSLSQYHAMDLLVHAAAKFLKDRNLDPAELDYGVLGMTVPQKSCFFGMPWVMARLGAPAGGVSVSQACATGAWTVATAAGLLQEGSAAVTLAVTADRVSNGPHLYYPKPNGPGGTGDHEDWVLDNFSHDPFSGLSMIETAENVARRFQISTSEQNDVTLCRYEQYADALRDNRAFLRKFMDVPFELPSSKGTHATLDGDEGIHATTAEGLARLKPVLESGSVTFGGQTHPADGNAGIVITTGDRASEYSRNPDIGIRIVSFGRAREEPGYMPAAPIPATKKALESARLGIDQIKTIKSHNPFVVNDIAFARSFGLDVRRMNNFGSSLVWGHPQAPTGTRAIIELIEELVILGGGYGLFQGCAAGDSAMAVILKVEDAR